MRPGWWKQRGKRLGSLDLFCLTAGIARLTQMIEEDSERLCGPRLGRLDQRAGQHWGRSTGRQRFHGGRIEVERPRASTRSSSSPGARAEHGSANER